MERLNKVKELIEYGAQNIIENFSANNEFMHNCFSEHLLKLFENCIRLDKNSEVENNILILELSVNISVIELSSQSIFNTDMISKEIIDNFKKRLKDIKKEFKIQ